jgi:hypothetical protein
MKKNYFLVFGLLLFHFSITAQCPGGVTVTEVLLDPNGSMNFDTDGDGSADTNDEFVKICNTSGLPADLSGVVINDPGSGDWFTFPAGSILADGACFTVINDWDGANPLPAGVFDADNGTTGIINNGGDVINLSLGGASCSTTVGGDMDGCVLDVPTGTDIACGDPDSYDFDSPSIVLPIDLIAFDAVLKDKQTMIEWQTATELNNDYMAVERSQNAKDFHEIGRVTGAGTSHEIQEYRFVDDAPVHGPNYYRLRQVDFDGTVDYSAVAEVNFKNTGDDFALYPNPTSALLTLVVPENWTGTTTLRFYNAVGQLEKTVLNLSDEKTVAVEDLSIGFYVLKITNGVDNKTLTFRKN